MGLCCPQCGYAFGTGLSASELALQSLFTAHPRQLVTFSEINEVLKPHRRPLASGFYTTETVRVLISRLRNKTLMNIVSERTSGYIYYPPKETSHGQSLHH